MQIASVTGVEYEELEVTGLGHGPLSDTADLLELGLRPGHVLSVRARAVPRGGGAGGAGGSGSGGRGAGGTGAGGWVTEKGGNGAGWREGGRGECMKAGGSVRER
eukprot:1901835-Rhodomonas_salina.1